MNEARRYRHSVSLQSATVTVDDLGQEVKTWSTVTTLRAEVRGLTGRELLQADQINTTAASAVIHRFIDESDDARPTVSHRYVLGSRVLSIVSISDPIGDRRELKAICTEDAAPAA